MKPNIFLHLTFIFLLLVSAAHSANALSETGNSEIIQYCTSLVNSLEETFLR